MVTLAQRQPVRESLPWPVKRSSGGMVGLAAALLLLLIGAGLLAWTTRQPLGAAALIGLALGTVDIGLAVAVAIATLGFFRLGYRLESDRLVIRGGGPGETIPLSEIEGIYAGQRVGPLRKVRGLSWPGYYVGVVRARGVGAVRVYCTDRRVESLSVIVTADRTLVLSPDDPPAFRRELIRRIESAPELVPAGEPHRAAGGPLPHPIVAGLFAASLAMLASSTLLVAGAYSGLPDLIALQVDPNGRAALVPRDGIFNLPLLGGGLLLLNLVAALAIRARGVAAPALLGGTSAVVQAVILLSALRILTP